MPKGFRYDINTLRAIAVFGVVAFHYNSALCPGGFAGVDVFFVISGYLMTRIIIGGLTNNNFSLADFYQKRLKRIVPALLFVILVVTLACFFLYFPADYRLTEKNAASSILFISNVVYQRRLNYFDPASNRNMFLHTWSLSVEWQFYLLYPLMLLLLSRWIKTKRSFLALFIPLTLLFFALSVIYTSKNPSASFYFLQSRCWEMLVGGLAYLLADKIKPGLWNKWGAFAGYFLIALSFFIFNTGTAWPGVYTLLPVLATFLVITANNDESGIFRNKALQFFGKISYSLYLWHWPVLVMAEYLGVPLRLLSAATFFIISTALAYFSYIYIEGANFNYKKILVAAVCFSGITLTLNYTSTNGFVFKPKTLSIANYAGEHQKEIKQQFGNTGCFVDPQDSLLKTFNKERCLNIEPGKKNIVLIGDSHAAELSQSLIKALKQQNTNLIQTTAIGCLPILQTSGRSECTGLVNYIYHDFIEKNAGRLDGVILSGNWMNAGPENGAELAGQLQATINFIEKHHLKVLIVGQSEVYHIPYTTIAAREHEYGIHLRHNALDQNAYKLNTLLQARLKPYYLDIYNVDSAPAVKDAPYMFDENHFTVYGAELTSDKILSNPLTKAFLRGGNSE